MSLPYPNGVSVNHCYSRGQKGVYLTPMVRSYRKSIWAGCVGKQKFGKELLDVEIEMFPPDERRRDVDNVLKVTLDSLAHAGVFTDDCQIVRLMIAKKEKVTDGRLDVTIRTVA